MTDSAPDDRALVAALAETTQWLVCVYDRRGRIVRFNRACEETTGFARDEVLGRDARALVIPAEDAEAFGVLLESAGRAAPSEARWLTRAGGRRLIAWTTAPVDGQLVATGLDITERAREAAELRRLADEQAALGRLATLVAGDAEPARIFQAVTEEVGALLGLRAALMQRFEDARTATIVGLVSDRPVDGLEVGTVQRLDEGLSALQVLRTGLPARVDNYEQLSGTTAGLVRGLGFRATVAVPITVAGATWGALIAGLREGESIPPETERRMAAFAEPVALALSSADARTELAASRARLVEAGYAARRRLERNLHDGAQQRLVSLSITLGRARRRLDDDHPAAALLREADSELKAGIKELRELAHGLHPAVLVERGLRPALAALAARAPFPVEVTGVPAQRLPEAVETTAYYVASEALANAAKHAGASSATARMEQSGGHALIEIADDGRGGATAGSGLRGLRDRVEALGGRLAVHSPPEQGTVVRAELPLAQTAV